MTSKPKGCREHCGCQEGEVATLKRTIMNLDDKNQALNNLLALKNKLLVCYRTGKRPSDKLLDDLFDAEPSVNVPPAVELESATCDKTFYRSEVSMDSTCGRNKYHEGEHDWHSDPEKK